MVCDVNIGIMLCTQTAEVLVFANVDIPIVAKQEPYTLFCSHFVCTIPNRQLCAHSASFPYLIHHNYHIFCTYTYTCSASYTF